MHQTPNACNFTSIYLSRYNQSLSSEICCKIFLWMCWEFIRYNTSW